jgi:uncharacterized protein YggU (UPF0235/DUF167 family)
MAYLRLRVTAGASRDGIAGWQGGVLRLRVAAAPERGKANEAVLRLLTAALGVERRRLRLVRGATSRDKVVEVEGLEEADVKVRLRSSRG